MKRLDLDRIALEDVGGNPEKVAEAIDVQLGQPSGAIPIDAVALSLDIQDIRQEPLTNLEAALVTTVEKSEGQILVNSRSSPQRRRFSVGHELFHFLSPWHKPTSQMGFECTREDMIVSESETLHQRQEWEANRFAIELLAPRRLLAPYLSIEPDLHHIVELARSLEVSKEAMARRYSSLHDFCVAVVYSKGGLFRYCSRPSTFPPILLETGDRMPMLPPKAKADFSEVEEQSAGQWLRSPAETVSVQTLYQSGGFEITLLMANTLEMDEELSGT